MACWSDLTLPRVDYSFYDLDTESLVRPSDLLIGDARGHRSGSPHPTLLERFPIRYKSIDRDLGVAQRGVLQTMLAAREAIRPEHGLTTSNARCETGDSTNIKTKRDAGEVHRTGEDVASAAHLCCADLT